jgi:hypothetical protein
MDKLINDANAEMEILHQKLTGTRGCDFLNTSR